jgi:hypothetical protein
MGLKEDRQAKKDERLAETAKRKQDSADRRGRTADRQLESDKRTYAHSPNLLATQPSSKGGIHDISTTNVTPENKEGAGTRVNEDAIDSIDPLPTENLDSGGGLPDGYVETAVILCVDGSPVNGQFLFKEDTA